MALFSLYISLFAFYIAWEDWQNVRLNARYGRKRRAYIYGALTGLMAALGAINLWLGLSGLGIV